MRQLLILLLVPFSAWAMDAPDLPSREQVEKALRTHPMVRGAVAAIRIEEANRDRLEAGPHEFALKLATQQRRDRQLELRYREREIGLERTIRLPGKSAQDAALGAAGIEHARIALGDALHETARLLLARWFEWQRETAVARQWAMQVEALRGQHAAVAKRVGAGDGAALEELLSGAQLAQAQAQLAQAVARRERVAVELAQTFPGIALPAGDHIPPPEPRPVGDSPEAWRQRILMHNHELAMARSAARRGQMLARRADADRMPDPTVGLTYGRERDGQERVLGLQLTIPLPGSGRAATARASMAEADVAGEREALALVRAEAEARRTISLAQSTRAQWLQLADVALRMEENVRRLEKAWRMGEGQFAELQSARRQAIEASLGAVNAGLEAREARYRLLLDAHQLWDLDGGEPVAGSPDSPLQGSKNDFDACPDQCGASG